MDQLPLVGVPPPPTPMHGTKDKATHTKAMPTTRMSVGLSPSAKAMPMPRFNGATYDHERDGVRLTAQLRRVMDVMSDGQWHTLSEVEHLTHDPATSISARLRDLRKPRFGGHTILREHVANGLHRYRMSLPIGLPNGM